MASIPSLDIVAAYRRRPLSCPERFDPYEDRLSRDIRNTLSIAFSQGVRCMDPERFRNILHAWRTLDLCPAHAGFLRLKERQFSHIFKIVRDQGIREPMDQAVVLWNEGLFFEFHEHVERLWEQSRGARWQALKGLIQAAACFVHRQRGKNTVALRLGEKAGRRLLEFRPALDDVVGIGALVDALLDERADAPCLKMRDAST